MTPADAIDEFAAKKLAALEAHSLRRELFPTARREAGKVTRGCRSMISFCDNDYLGLSQDPRVIEAGVKAARAFGAGAGASRLVSGECPLNGQVENKIAVMKNMPAARIFGSGYLANIGVIPVLAGAGDLIVIDELAHACLHAGAKLSGAEIRPFRHNDIKAACEAFANSQTSRRKLLITETIFSMDGDAAPLKDLAKLCCEENAWLVSDDAHGFGVVNIDNPAPIQLGTLSKAVGVYGGYVCGPVAFVELLASRARSFVYTTGLPPAVLGAIMAALEIIEKEPARGAKAVENAVLFAKLAGQAAPDSAIVPIIFGDERLALEVSETLAAQGFLVSAIRPPTVPSGTARLRFTFTAAHKQNDVYKLGEGVSTLLETEKTKISL